MQVPDSSIESPAHSSASSSSLREDILRALKGIKQTLIELTHLPLEIYLVALAIVLLYVPVFMEVIPFQWTNGTYSYGILIPPISLIILYLLRNDVKKARSIPDSRGMLSVLFGLLILAGGWYTRIKFLEVLSLVPLLYGTILALHGRNLWNVIRFPILFLAFAAPIPVPIINPPDAWVQHFSSVGSADIMKYLGFTLYRQGNTMQIPGMTIDVAEACSGFKKLLSFFCFAVLYGWIFSLKKPKWALLVIVAFPIAIIANIIRISGLIGIGCILGAHSFHVAHEYADFFVIFLSCILFLYLGRKLGCTETRFSHTHEEIQ